jgi:hypothetical protein
LSDAEERRHRESGERPKPEEAMHHEILLLRGTSLAPAAVAALARSGAFEPKPEASDPCPPRIRGPSSPAETGVYM